MNNKVGSLPGPCWHDRLLYPGQAVVWDLVFAAAFVLGTDQVNIQQAARVVLDSPRAAIVT